MTARYRLVSLNGSPRPNSRTDTLVLALGDAIGASIAVDWQHYQISEIGPLLLSSLMRDQVTSAANDILRDIEAADILIVGTPVYRASLTGALKHVFDLVDYRALRGRIAALAATGGNRHHGLVTEHQLRPLLSFFGVITAPTAIYAEDADFDGQRIDSVQIRERIAAAAREVADLAASVIPRAPAENITQEVLP
jgi:FMN reductase